MAPIHSKTPKAYARGGKEKAEHHEEKKEENKLKHPERFESSLSWIGEEKGEHEDEEGLDEKPHYAEGGSVGSWTKREDNERGINREMKQGESRAGMAVREGSMDAAKANMHKSMKEMKLLPKPKLYASGGSVDDVPEAPSKNAKAMQSGATSSGVPSWEEAKNNIKESLGMAEGGEVEGDDELSDMMGQEHMDALDSKDKKRIMQSIEAIVLSCMNKE